MDLAGVIRRVICLVAVVVSTAIAAPQKDITKDSPCPDLFRYDSVNQPGLWSGNLSLISEDDLHGVWIRLMFNNKLKELIVDGNYDVVTPLDSNEILIKNRDVLLKAGSATNVKITVKYEGNKFPSLTGYRLNARTICPEPNAQRDDYFQGDKDSKDFLQSLLSYVEPIASEAKYKCGLKQPSDSLSQPWNADIFIKKGDKEQYACKATLISPSHVITPAHCVTFKNQNIEVPATSLLVYLARDKDTDHIRIATVSKVKVHPGYEPSNLFDDIAILELKEPVILNENVKPICLPSKPYEGQLNIEEYHIIHGKGSGEVGITKIDEDECTRKAPELKNIISDNNYCLSYLPDYDINCAAESGSRLVSFEDSVFVLKGMVTLSPALQSKETCDQDTVLLAIDMTRYLKWILYVLH